MEGIKILKDNLNKFLRKYYLNQTLRGIIFFVIFAILIILFFSLTEHFSRLNTTGRSILFFTALIAIVAFVFTFILFPISKFFKITKTLSLKNSAIEVSDKMPEITDKLVNIIELDAEDSSIYTTDLLIAAINQKSEQLKVFDFRKAVNYKQNYKYLKYLIPVILVLLLIFVFNPQIITGSTERIVSYNKEFIQETLVVLQLKSKNLTVRRGEDFKIVAKSVGKVNPSEVYISFGGKDMKMRKNPENKTEFYYEFKNLNNSLDFKLYSSDFESTKYKLKVLSPPVVLDFFLKVNTPAYTLVKDTIFKNIGDISLPAGSYVTWSFKTLSTDSLLFNTKFKKYFPKSINNAFIYQQRVLKDLNYSVKVINTHFKNEDFINYKLSVIPDLFPQIAVEQKVDSTVLSRRFFKGFVQDDYGVSKLAFKYSIIDLENPKNDNNKFETIFVPVSKISEQQEFYYSFDISQLTLNEGYSVKYYFEVYDNDAVIGSKSARSQIFNYTKPSFKEELNQFDKLNQDAQNTLSEAMAKAKDLQKSLKDFQKSSIDNSATDWEKKQFIQNLATKQDELRRLIEESKKQLNKAEQLAKSDKQDEELAKKLEELQKLTDELLTDEIKKLMDEINKLADKFDQEKLDELINQQSEEFKDLDKMLERNLELLKRFKVEQKVEKVASELEKLAEETQKLSEETKKGDQTKEQLSKKNEEIKEKYNTLEQEYNEAQDENKQLETPYKLDEFQEESEQIKEEFSNSEEKLQKGKNKKASESQKQNSQNMKKMAKSMQSMMQQNTQSQDSENLENLKTILENLISLSFSQESLSEKFQGLSHKDPKYGEYAEEQLTIRNEYDLISDSLFSLSKRMFVLANIINKETSIIDDNIALAIENLKQHKTRNAVIGQVKVMQSSNNLALLIASLIDQMSMEGSGSGGGSGKPKKGKAQKPDFDGMKQQQEGLKKQLEEMLKKMKEGGNKPGGEQGQLPSDKQLAQMLAQQEIFRQKLAEMKSKHSLGQDTKKLLNEVSQLTKKNEEQLINKRITPELFERQKLIQTRLLEAEQAENKRKTEPKREAKTAKDLDYPSPEDVFLKDKNDSGIKENLNKDQLLLKPFYRKVFEQYSKEMNK